MGWVLSRFRAGDLVEVRSREEILASLDRRGCRDGMPFMPEMLPFCGRRMKVRAVAHKTCDTAHQTWKGRRLQATVHLAGAECDGAGHGGCQAGCSLFWKDAWLKPADQDRPAAVEDAPATFAEADLLAGTRAASSAGGGETRYSCQATEMYDATRPLPWWDVRQYVFDALTGNHTAGRVLRVLLLACVRRIAARAPLGRALFNLLSQRIHRGLSGRPAPSLHGRVPRGTPTPAGRIDLAPGEMVRIRTQAEIEMTLDETGRNRGLYFDPEEMAPYCGGIYRVRTSVTRIIEEPTGKMLQMKQPCIRLEGVTCKALYAGCRLNCPRELPSFWRELWLERVHGEQSPGER